MNETMLTAGDHPIRSYVDDRLGRKLLADRIGSELRALDASRGAVVGLFGSWGSGKTSLLNLIEEALESPAGPVTIRFDPWMFSGTDQLLTIFFEELAGQLRLKEAKLDKIAGLLADYGGLIGSTHLPVVGAVGAIGGRTAGAWRKRRSKDLTVTAQKRRLVDALSKLDTSLVVMIDDIDRLERGEARDIFRLVRLVGEFPNVTYVLAFDRQHVERMLSADGFDGRSYLEKIIALPIELPPLPEPTLLQLLVTDLGQITDGLTTGPFDEQLWQEILFRCVRPLFSNVREVKRYLAVLRTTLVAMGDEIALVDVLALEAVRVRLPDVHALLCANVAGLTDQRSTPGAVVPDDLRGIIEAGGDHEAVVRDLCKLLFPATDRFFSGTTWGSEWQGAWHRERRVAHSDVFRFYVHGVLPTRSAPAGDVEATFEALVDESALRSVLAGLSGDVIEDVLSRLEAFEDDFPAGAAVPACTVLLDQYARLRTTSLGMFDIGPELAVDRLVVRLMRKLPSDEALRAIEHVLGNATSLYGRLRFLWIVGNRDGIGHGYIRVEDERRFAAELCVAIRRSDVRHLSEERDVLALLNFALETDSTSRADVDSALNHDAVFEHVLLDAMSEMRSQALGSTAQHREPTLHWETLVSALGSESELQERLTQWMITRRDDPDPQVVAAAGLVTRYLKGWRPREPFHQPHEFSFHPATNSPHNAFPPAKSGEWPDLVIRATCSYRVTPNAKGLEIPGREFHTRLEAALNASILTTLLRQLAQDRTDVSADAWHPDKDSYSQSSRLASSTLQVTAAGSPVSVEARCGVLLPDGMSSSLRVIVDVLVSLGGRDAVDGSDAGSRGRVLMSLGEVRDVLAAEIDIAARDVQRATFPMLLSDRLAAPAAVEVHVTAGDVVSVADGFQGTIAESVDLAPLGQSGSTQQRELQRGFAGDTPLSTGAERNAVLFEVLRRTAIDWGYLDAADGLRSALGDDS